MIFEAISICGVPHIDMTFKFKIVSGGQTGVDRAALDWAIMNHVPHGGWCPKGRLAEDGPIPECYLLQETPSADSRQRTEWNVRDSDGTVILSLGPNLTGGSELTRQLARKLGKPLLHLCQSNSTLPGAAFIQFIRDRQIHTLNVAGPKASEESGILPFVHEVLGEAFFDTD
jgi:hypothetical protein